MIDKIVKYNYCTGCGLCQSFFGRGNVTVELDKNGFYRPTRHKTLNRQQLAKFSEICPGSILNKKKISAPIIDPIWGDIFSCIVGSSSDLQIRDEASSGGAITGILTYLLENKLVDAVVHIGPSVDTPFQNEVKVSTSKEEVIENANSRYSPSAPLIDIIDQLEKYDSFAFVGKPCDVAGLRQLSYHSDLVKEKVKYYIAFFCAGTPSLNATKSIVEAMGVDLNNVASLHYRKDGWPGYFRIIDKENNRHKLSYSLTWMKLLGPTMQFRCKICVDGVGHFADIVCADAWEDYNEKGFPTFKNAPGKSLIISRTITGDSLLNKAIEEGFIDKSREINNHREIDKMQPGQIFKKVSFLSRYLAVCLRNRTVPHFNKEFYIKATSRQSITAFIKNFVGTWKRMS